METLENRLSVAPTLGLEANTGPFFEDLHWLAAEGDVFPLNSALWCYSMHWPQAFKRLSIDVIKPLVMPNVQIKKVYFILAGTN